MYCQFKNQFTDTNENVQTITYSNNRITKITDPVGRAVTFQYNADGQLIAVKDPSNRATSYEYQDGKLIKITYPDDKTTEFEYTSGNLTKLIGIDKSYAQFGYKSVTVPGKTSYRTESAKFYGTQGGLQDSYFYTFAPSSTKVEDNFGHSETMMFDSAGRSVCVTDENGREFYGDYNKSGNKNNTLKYQSDMQQTITNLVENSGAETGNETS